MPALQPPDLHIAVPDLAAPGDLRPSADLAVASCCGFPGDTGNALGVGRYCQGLADCASNSKATLCSSIGNSQSSQSFFCTMLCDPDAGDGPCGAGARCQCDNAGGGCACTPTRCAGTNMLGCGSCCGLPGDAGNNLGVGKFCKGIVDCAGNGKATLCSSIGNTTERKTFYCTFLCDKNQGDAQCGTGATCQCSGAGCACTPTQCVRDAPARCSN